MLVVWDSKNQIVVSTKLNFVTANNNKGKKLCELHLQKNCTLNDT